MTLRGDTINVLNHGFVRIVDWMGSDLSIVRAARVSFDADWRAGEDDGKDAKLIRYLLANKHTSPFECVVFTFEIKCPIFVARQWHRHRTWAYNEVSARYSELPDEWYVPEPENMGKQSKDNKQARDLNISDQDGKALTDAAANAFLIGDSCEESFRVYQALLARGVPRELARGVLPVNTFTRYFGSVNLHNLFHFLSLRLHPHAQYEIREYAAAILSLIEEIVPVTIKHWRELWEKANV